MKILFQGDSITDADRDRSNYHNLSGYTKYVQELLGEEIEYVNLGIAQEKSKDLLKRYETDIKAIHPNILTILIGINDVWHAFNREEYTSPTEYYNNLKEIVVRAKKDIEGVKIIILEPYLLPEPNKAYWRPHMVKFVDMCRKVAIEEADVFIPLDGIFAKECLKTDWRLLAEDGVHPNKAGQKLIAKELAKEIKNLIK